MGINLKNAVYRFRLFLHVSSYNYFFLNNLSSDISSTAAEVLEKYPICSHIYA